MIPETSEAEYLYLHVPFCRTICSYCDFCHTVYRSETADQWLKAAALEIEKRKINPHLKTIYIGGGTPTSLSSQQLDKLLSLLDPYRNDIEEYTVEVNPETLDECKAEILAAHGVNRISMGFQSSDRHLLKMMNRHHSMDTVRKAVEYLKKNSIVNLSLDLMYSLPSQTMEQLKTSVEDALSLHPVHLSLYSLTIEENTQFGKRGYDHLDDDTEADMYEMICTMLEKRGFHQYEISNFSLPGYESKHNKAYWYYEDFAGISCGASGKEKGIRYDVSKSLKEYISGSFQYDETPLAEEDMMFENVMMGLRLKEGMPLDVFRKRYGKSFEEAFQGKAEQLIEKQLIELTGSHVRCTDRGYEILNSVLVELL